MPAYVRARGCETNRQQLRNQHRGQQGSFGVQDALAELAAGHHDDPDVTEHGQTARDASPDISAVVIFQDDGDSSSDGHSDIERLAVLRRDWLEVDTRTNDMESTDDRRLNGAVLESRPIEARGRQ